MRWVGSLNEVSPPLLIPSLLIPPPPHTHTPSSTTTTTKVTRKTRRLVKQTLLMDLNGAKLTSMMDTRGHEIHKPVSEMSFYLYPQLQGPFIMVNCPSWITVLWTAIKQGGS